MENKIYERTENGITAHVSVREGLDEINHAMMGGRREVRTMSSITRTDYAIEYKDGRSVRLVLVDAPEQTSPRFAFEDLVTTNQGLGKVARVISVPRRNGTRNTRYTVELNAGGEIDVHESDVTPFEQEAKSPEPTSAPGVHVVSVRGGKVHTAMPGMPEDHAYPLCRGGGMNNLLTKFRVVAAPLTCTTCLTYAERRAARLAREGA
ncbi:MULTISPECIES: hypothetical protein [unclassified Streptomyces]|uniref:hypothetical protein n=1 Tax=unclassified Streptomyces TaxID=2593676 RepID=UPI0033E98BF0